MVVLLPPIITALSKVLCPWKSEHCVHTFLLHNLVYKPLSGSEVLVHNLFTPGAISIINCIVGHRSVNFHQCLLLLQRTKKVQIKPLHSMFSNIFLRKWLLEGSDSADGAKLEINEMCLCVSYLTLCLCILVLCVALHLCQCVRECHAAWASVSPSLTNAVVSHNMCAPRSFPECACVPKYIPVCACVCECIFQCVHVCISVYSSVCEYIF